MKNVLFYTSAALMFLVSQFSIAYPMNMQEQAMYNAQMEYYNNQRMQASIDYHRSPPYRQYGE